jgi:ribosomal protein S18 acetylase RimI-like enzyme
MHIRVQTWDEVAKERLVQYLFETRRAEGVLEEPTSTEPFSNYLQWVSERQDSVPIIAYANKEIVGWLAFFSFVPKIATIGRWHPIVKPGSNRDHIAVELLKASRSHGIAQGFNRLEAELTEITSHNEPRAQLYQRWLEAEGWYLATEEARLERNLTDDLQPPIELPSEFELVQFQEFTNEELQPFFFEMFNNSIDRFWLDQTPAQRLDTFNFWFNRERPVIGQATRILVKDSEIIGITVVRPIQEVGMLGPIGIIPQYRRQGLGRILLAFSLHRTLAAGFPKVQLEFDITNEPAFALYRSMGFQHVHALRIFVKPL